MKMEKDNFYILASASLLFLLVLMPTGKKDIPAMNLAAMAAPVDEVKPLPVLEGKSALAYDLTAGKIIFEKDKSIVLPLASIAKIGSVLTLLDMLSPSEEVEISRSAILTPEQSSLKKGEHFLARDLFAMAMVESSNDAVTALVEAAGKENSIPGNDSEEWFVNLVNSKVNQLGAFSMRYGNPTGLDISSTEAGVFGSAEDLINISKATIDSEMWQFGDITEVVSKEGFIHPLHPTNLLKKDINGLIGSKTGFTDLAGGNLLVIVEHPYLNGHIYAIVVLGSSEEGRFEDIKKILKYIKSL